MKMYEKEREWEWRNFEGKKKREETESTEKVTSFGKGQ
jgi:hypothetical protein